MRTANRSCTRMRFMLSKRAIPLRGISTYECLTEVSLPPHRILNESRQLLPRNYHPLSVQAARYTPTMHKPEARTGSASRKLENRFYT
jgi:hypothetical protein